LSLLPLSREDRFLFSYSVRPARETAAPSKEDLRDLDWAYIYGTASFHMIAQALYFNLAERGEIQAVPSEIRLKLKRLFHGNLSRNLGLKKKVREILQAIEENGMPVIVLKGAALLDRIYENPALRQMLDLDILVQKKDRHRVFEILQSLGYTIQKPYDGPGHDRWFEHFCYHLRPLISPDKKLVVEIHWDLIRHDVLSHYPFYGGLIIEDFWANGIMEGETEGERGKILKPEYNLLHLSLHNIAHQLQMANFNMNNLRDMYHLLDHYENRLDWPLFLALARRHRLEKAAYFSFWMLREFLNRPVKDQVMDRLYPGFMPLKMFQSYLQSIFIQHYKKIRSKKVSRLQQIFIADTSYGVAGTAGRYFFPPAKVMAERFPGLSGSGLLFLAYLIFPFLALKKITGQLCRFAFSR